MDVEKRKKTSGDILYSKTGNDEKHTPRWGVEPILPYIPKGAIVWCPFDTADSEYVKLISKTNKVVYSHIDLGMDYYKTEPKEWDIMISNPPFKNKKDIFLRALSFNKPFALLMAVTWLNDATPVKIFKDKGLQLLLMTRRIQFIDAEGVMLGRPSFSSAYFCRGILPQSLLLVDPPQPRKKRIENLRKVKILT